MTKQADDLLKRILTDLQSLLLLLSDSPALPVDVTPVVTPPVVVTPEPTLPTFLGKVIGNRGSNPVHLSQNNKSLYELDGDKPVPRGFNLEYTLLAGVQRPTGAESANYGTSVPIGYVLPEGWSWQQYKDKAYYIASGTSAVSAPAQLTASPSVPVVNTKPTTTLWQLDQTS